MTKDNISVILAVTITALWTVSFFADLIFRWYDPPATIHALMMAVAGGFLAPEALKGIRNDRKE